MRILLIADQNAEYKQLERLLGSMEGVRHQLTWCQSDISVLEATPASAFHLILWGRVSEAPLSRRILQELNRQNVKTPIIVITDRLPAGADAGACARGESDILLREQLTAPLLARALALAVPPAAERVHHARNVDPLTGLINRSEFRDQLDRVLANATTPESVGLLLVDVDQFKKVNASYGQGAGDALIQLIAERIATCLSAHHSLARIGGNEFAVVYQNALGSVDGCRAHR